MRSSIRKSTVFVCLAAGLGGAGVAQATNGYQLIGVGAYQKSLGGAVTANPGSAMTAISNPAGMARIGRRADFSMEAFMPERHVDFAATGGERGKSSMDMYGVPAIGWTAPVGDRDDLWFGGGMYGTSGMGVDYAPTFMVPAGAMGMNPDMYWDGYSNIMLWQMAPTLAWDVDDRLTVGASLNINYQSVAFKQRVMGDTTADGQGDLLLQNFDLSRASSAFGFGVSLGALFDVNDRLTVGAAYKSKQVFSDLEYNLAQGDIGELNMGTGEYEGAPAGVYRLGLDFPQQLALGLAFRATPDVTVSADLKWINWSDTMDKLSVNGPHGVSVAMDPGWDDQVVYALGVDWTVNNRLNLRAGVNYAESPIGAEEVSRNLILPAVVETHYTLGAGYKVNGSWDLGVHYMYVPEKSFSAPADDPMLPGSRISLSEQSFGANLGYRF